MHKKYPSYVVPGRSFSLKIEDAGAGYDFDVLRAKVMMCVGHKIEISRYGSGTFSNMLLGGDFWDNTPKDYGVPFDNIIKAIDEGLL